MGSAVAGSVRDGENLCGRGLTRMGKLGYPRRAMRLHECATVLARDYDDQVPGDVETLLTLPGVGAYTARAIACFGYGQRVPVVDTNVRRVIARVVHGVADSAPSARDLRDAEALLPTENGARFSAALMELGALVCTARTPQCPMCPLSSCAWHEAGQPRWMPRHAPCRNTPVPIVRCVGGYWMFCAAAAFR